MLTFDGNVRVKKKVTFKRIKEHLQSVYGEEISYGTIVQLCVARNKRHRSAKNYRGVAKVTSRRARKALDKILHVLHCKHYRFSTGHMKVACPLFFRKMTDGIPGTFSIMQETWRVTSHTLLLEIWQKKWCASLYFLHCET